ncbi:hypothetical protein [Teredinibacter sp. KSP-S5-2]|uniref:hypothetical protein n=1 Tax=Teredinibacter sp. KSP-S5-2 TaxID=3034506 RepID=UPI002934BABB|nr:hypothetical protein [Teredinibacter sp. KSP-S5-2]WNO08044.1 hypothetical protein P5V12_13765 [Teredinibacter sp. KSP-S5-2]
MPDIVSFNKGHYYLLGLGVCVGVFGLIATLEHWFSIILSEATVKKLFRVAVLGLMLGLLLPHFSHFGFSRYFQSHGYISCDAASHRWLHSVILVYTKNEMLCKELIEARK